jgi:hypothetical protein
LGYKEPTTKKSVCQTNIGVINGECPLCGQKLEFVGVRMCRMKSTQFGGDGLWYHEDCWMVGRKWSSEKHEFVLEGTK